MTADGIMTMRFNKPILMPSIQKTGNDDDTRRDLQSISVQDFVEMRIKDADIDDDELDKDMCNFILEEVEDTFLKIGIDFCNPSDITNELKEPDIL